MNSWLGTEIKQLPGLIKSSWHSAFDQPDQNKSSNATLQFQQQPFITYTKIIEGLTSPVAFVQSPFNGLYYVVDQIGYVYVYDGQTMEMMIDISKEIIKLNSMYDERGLLNLVFHPFEADLFYLYYTVPSTAKDINCEARLEEWILAPDGRQAKKNRILFQWEHQEANHFGSPIGFGSDGLLYMATGDGGGAGDRHGEIGNAQNLESQWGKILTIDVNKNPVIIELYAIGFRNPWRCSFMSDGRLIVGDVGQDLYEGVHIVNRDENHEWRAVENGHIFDQALFEQIREEITPPLFWYNRSLGRSVIGGYETGGGYIFGDYTGGSSGDNVYLYRNGKILIQPKVEGRTKFLHSFGRDNEGNIYGLFEDKFGPSGKAGTIYRLSLNF